VTVRPSGNLSPFRAGPEPYRNSDLGHARAGLSDRVLTLRTF
jgi:hypothetical protein